MQYVYGFLWSLLLLGTMTRCTELNAAEYRLLELDYLGFDTYKIENYRGYGYDIPSNDWVAGNAINFNLCLICRPEHGLYWNNQVYGNATEFQYREVAWAYDLGVAITPKVSLFWSHESRHLLDMPAPPGGFPLRDKIVLRIHFYQRGDR